MVSALQNWPSLCLCSSLSTKCCDLALPKLIWGRTETKAGDMKEEMSGAGQDISTNSAASDLPG